MSWPPEVRRAATANGSPQKSQYPHSTNPIEISGQFQARSASPDARLQTSREWMRTRQGTRSASSSAPPLPLVPIEPDPAEPEAAAEGNRSARRAAAACLRLHQAETEIINEALADRGVDRFRRGSDFRRPPKNNVDRNFVDKVWRAATMIERKSWSCRAKGKHGGSLGAVAIEVLRTLLFVIRKSDGQLYPSLETIARLSRKSKQAIVTAIKVLERMGFLTVYRRVKRIDTPFGVRVVQDSNAYQFHLPTKGLGALAMAVFCRPSESTKLDAIKHQGENHTETASGNAATHRWWLLEPLQTGSGGWR